jgi:hemoglobin
VELDASLAPVFGGTVTVEHREHVTEWWYEVMGGPATGLPDDPEFRAAVMGYAEWGTRLAVSNSAHGATPAPHAPVPRWGRGVAPPYQP